jgi:hypothetical protein
MRTIEDGHPNLQIWCGQSRETEQPLLDSPVAALSFHVEGRSQARLAVAAGADVYIFLGTKPHFKASLPIAKVDSRDEAIWHASPH